MDRHGRERHGSEQLLGGYEGRLLIGFSLGYLVIQFGRNILSPLLPAIIDDLNISSFQAGIALSIIAATYALSMYPGGRLSDQLSRKSVLVTAGFLALGGMVVLAMTFRYEAFLVGAGLVGLGSGLYWISLRALLADLYIERRGEAFGLQDSLGFAGPLLAAGGAIIILAIAPWRSAFLPVIAFLCVAVFLSHHWLDEPYVVSGVELDIGETFTRIFGDRNTRRLLIGYTSAIFAMQAVIGFLPLFLQVEHGFSGVYSSAGFGILFLGAMVTLPISGHLGDRFGYIPVAVGGLLISVVSLLGFVFLTATALIMFCIFGFGVGIWAFTPVIQAYLMTHFPTESMGGDYGAFKTVYAGVGSLGPAYVGYVAGILDYLSAFIGLVVFLILAIVVFSRE